eukprot:7581203-Pyramimonas_sp.AAC.3
MAPRPFISRSVHTPPVTTATVSSLHHLSPPVAIDSEVVPNKFRRNADTGVDKIARLDKRDAGDPKALRETMVG